MSSRVEVSGTVSTPREISDLMGEVRNLVNQSAADATSADASATAAAASATAAAGSAAAAASSVAAIIPPDPTLAIEGRAAEAKATGDALREIRMAVGTPLVASTIADMTDQTKAYVYTGSETGYIAGNWYYYDTSLTTPAWVSGGVYNSTAFETDTTLTVPGAAADAEKTGDEIADLKSAINGFYHYGDPVYITTWEQGYIHLADGTHGEDSAACRTQDVISVQGKKKISIASGLKIQVYEYATVYQAGYIGRVLNQVSGDVEYDFGSGHYFKFVVRKTDDTNISPSDLSSTSVGYADIYTTDKTLTLSDFAADAKATGDAIEEIKTMLSDVVSFSNNLLNPADVTEHAYISPNGLQTSSTYAGWFVTGYIDVNGETSLQSSIPIKSIIIYNYDGTVDKTNSYDGLNTSATLPFSIPSTARKIRISAYMADLNDAMINYGTNVLPYQKYGAEINQDALKENPVLAKLNSHTTTENYLTSCKQALKKDVLLSYFATFTGFTSLKIGFTTSDNYATGYLDYIEITGTNFILHRKNQNDITWTHGLTLKDYVSVHITFDFSMNFSAVVKTNGGEFAKTNYFYLGASYYPFAILEATGTANNNLSFSCADFQKNVLLFGDSYFSNASTRWLYYLTAEQQKNLCINGYAGESSPSAISDCETLFGLCTPKFAVWCLGMNDGSDANDTTPSTQWLSNVQKFINFCAEKNIQPILATIPSVPTINNRAKSAWVRESGYRYIDFAYAVNNGNDGSWYDNMLSGDGVHPDVAGAKALYDRAITDFPELLID